MCREGRATAPHGNLGTLLFGSHVLLVIPRDHNHRRRRQNRLPFMHWCFTEQSVRGRASAGKKWGSSMKTTTAVVLLLALGMLSGSCKNPSGPGNSTPVLQVHIVDGEGAPIDSVGFHFIPRISASAVSKWKPDQTCPTTFISYTIPARSHVRIDIFRWFTREFITTLVDDTLDAGQYASSVSKPAMTSGIYVYRLSIGDSTSEHALYLLKSPGELGSATPLAVSNTAGELSVAKGVFGIGMVFERGVWDSTFGLAVISDTIDVVLYRQGFQMVVQGVGIDPDFSSSMELVMRR